MRLAVAVAAIVNGITVALVGAGLTGVLLTCAADGCGSTAVLLGVAFVSIVVGLGVWWRGDPRPLLVVDLCVLAATLIGLTTGTPWLADVGTATLVLGGPSFLLPFAAMALGRLSLERAPAGPVERAPVSTGAVAMTGAGDAAAAASFTALMDRIDRLPPDGVRLLAVRPLDPTAHERARETALERLAASGRLDALAAAREAVATWVRRWQGGEAFDPTFVAVAWRHEPLRPEDRLRLVRTIEDAAIAELSADLVDEATFDELLGPCADLVGP